MYVEGILLKYKKEQNKKGRKERPRLYINQCPIHGNACTKSRSMYKDRPRFGAIGCQLFLGAWLAAEEMKGRAYDCEQHSAYDPTIEDMEAYGRSRGLL